MGGIGVVVSAGVRRPLASFRKYEFGALLVPKESSTARCCGVFGGVDVSGGGMSVDFDGELRTGVLTETD